jgi:hypothetical protein
MTLDEALAMAERLNLRRSSGSNLSYAACQVKGFVFDVLCRDYSVPGSLVAGRGEDEETLAALNGITPSSRARRGRRNPSSITPSSRAAEKADPTPYRHNTGYQPIGGGYEYAALRIGLSIRNPQGKEIYVQPGDEIAMREKLAALDEISLDAEDAERGAIADMLLGDYFA